MSASAPKATGGVQLILMRSRYLIITVAVQPHVAAGELPKARSVCGITVEQSPSGKPPNCAPNTKAKGNGLGVSAQLIGGESGEGGGEGDRKVKQTLKPLSWVLPSDDQLNAEASTPSGPSVPE
eukprot:scaffold32981_cov66-Phaeocystis_antarctica.AAC.10